MHPPGVQESYKRYVLHLIRERGIHVLRLMELIKQHLGLLDLYKWFATKTRLAIVFLGNVLAPESWQKIS